jgi:hypothetical protein
MRPTAVIADLPYHGKSIVLIGGTETRENFAYSIAKNAYRKLAALPVGHNITTNVCVNFKDKAIFTFIHDAKLSIKVAVMDLSTIDENEDEEGAKQMEWVLKMEQAEHTLDRFHLKCGIAMGDDRIAIMARGRLPGMRENIASLLLYFRVKKENGKWTATFETPQIIWPTCFPRHLDHIQRVGDRLVVVQDTADNEPFEAFNFSTTQKRKDGKYQVHQKHFFKD